MKPPDLTLIYSSTQPTARASERVTTNEEVALNRQIDDSQKLIEQNQISPHFQNDLVFKSKLHQGYKGILDLLKDKDNEKHSTALNRNKELKELLA